MKQKCLYDGNVYVGVMILMIMVMMNHCSASAMKQIIVIEMIVMVVVVIVMVVNVIVTVVKVIVMVVLRQGSLCKGAPLGAWGTK